jgi:hypothetical protein
LGCVQYFLELFISHDIGGQSPANIVAIAVLSGSALGVFSWAGGLGGLTSVHGVDIRKALQYQQGWRWYPTDKIPLEDYERAIGRRTHPEDFADISGIFGERALEPIPTDVVGIAPIAEPRQKWWKEVLEKARADDKRGKNVN